VHELSRQDARRIAVRAQLLDSPRPGDVLEVIARLTLLQDDRTAAVAPSADLVLWSRLGSSYAPEELRAHLRGGALVELQGMIRPSEDIALYRAEMDVWRGDEPFGDWRDSNRAWVQDNDAFRRDVLARLGSQGPLTSTEIPDTAVVSWQSSGWNNDRNVVMMLNQLVLRGEVAAAGRRGREALWHLAPEVYPDDPVVPADEAVRTRNELRLRALGIARAKCTVPPGEPNHVGEAGEAAVVEGVKGTWRVDPAQLGQDFSGRTALLSPLDRLVFDRKRMEELFGFDYQLEMYKPVARRRWGYFALPILSGDRLVGKVDATSDRKAGVLRVDAIHEDVAFDKAVTAEVLEQIEDLAVWLELELSLSR
jgi:uncharacterized protein YcaQ